MQENITIRPSGGGGGRRVWWQKSARLTSLTFEKTPANLVAFPKFYLATSWYDKFWPKEFDVSMETVS